MKKTLLQDQIRKYYIALSAAMLFIVCSVIALFGARLYWQDISEMCISDVELNHDMVISRLTEIRNNQEILAKSSSTREMAEYYRDTGGEDPVINLAYQHQIRGSFYLLSRNFSINSVYLVNTDPGNNLEAPVAASGQSIAHYAEVCGAGYALRCR